MTDDTSLIIRAETSADVTPVRAVLEAAFKGDAEAKLITRLRREGELMLALVADDRRAGVVGYIAFPRLALQTGNHSEPAVALAPLAVAPNHQRRGIGSKLVREGLHFLRERRERLIFVLGDRSYYGRFGFRFGTFSLTLCGPTFHGTRAGGWRTGKRPNSLSGRFRST